MGSHRAFPGWGSAASLWGPRAGGNDCQLEAGAVPGVAGVAQLHQQRAASRVHSYDPYEISGKMWMSLSSRAKERYFLSSCPLHRAHLTAFRSSMLWRLSWDPECSVNVTQVSFQWRCQRSH